MDELKDFPLINLPSIPVSNQPISIDLLLLPVSNTFITLIQAKKQGCPLKTSQNLSAELSTKKCRLVWSCSEIETLLHICYQDDYIKHKFLNAKNNYQKARVWAVLTLRFYDMINKSFTEDQIKKKLEKLVAEYCTLKNDLEKTRNNIEIKPNLPEYWATMVDCFENRLGLSGDSLGDSENFLLNTKNNQEDVDDNIDIELESLSSTSSITDLKSINSLNKVKKDKSKEKGIELMASAMRDGLTQLSIAMITKSKNKNSFDKFENVLEIQTKTNIQTAEKLEKTLDTFIKTQTQSMEM